MQIDYVIYLGNLRKISLTRTKSHDEYGSFIQFFPIQK